MFRAALRGISFCLLLASAAGDIQAQSLVLDLPSPSQRAQISQRSTESRATSNVS